MYEAKSMVLLMRDAAWASRELAGTTGGLVAAARRRGDRDLADRLAVRWQRCVHIAAELDELADGLRALALGEYADELARRLADVCAQLAAGDAGRVQVEAVVRYGTTDGHDAAQTAAALFSRPLPRQRSRADKADDELLDQLFPA